MYKVRKALFLAKPKEGPRDLRCHENNAFHLAQRAGAPPDIARGTAGRCAEFSSGRRVAARIATAQLRTTPSNHVMPTPGQVAQLQIRAYLLPGACCA